MKLYSNNYTLKLFLHIKLYSKTLIFLILIYQLLFLKLKFKMYLVSERAGGGAGGAGGGVGGASGRRRWGTGARGLIRRNLPPVETAVGGTYRRPTAE